MKHVIPVCATCGSREVRRNADTAWSLSAQDWEVITLFDSHTCEKCGKECTVRWEEATAWTVLLLRPDYRAATFGHDTLCLHLVQGPEDCSVQNLIPEALPLGVDDWNPRDDDPADWYILSCIKGHHEDYIDGQGGVNA